MGAVVNQAPVGPESRTPTKREREFESLRGTILLNNRTPTKGERDFEPLMVHPSHRCVQSVDKGQPMDYTFFV